MRIKFLLAGLLGVATTSAFAQKYEVTHAKECYEKYLTLNKVKATFDEADKNLVESKRAIDKAAGNDKSATLPTTYAVKAAVYATYAIRDTSKAGLQSFGTADEAFKKAKEVDASADDKVLIDDAAMNLAQYQLNKGVVAYTAKNYDAAYKAFDYYHTILPQDTIGMYYSGLAAFAGGNVDNALASYDKLLASNFSKKANIYLDMSTIYLTQKKDTANALKYAVAGVEKYPNNSDLRRREIEIGLLTGHSQEVLGKIQTAIDNDPKNKALYYYAGLTYSTQANTFAPQLQKLKKDGKDQAGIAALQAKKDDAITKAVDMYKKALDIDPNYFEANLNLGNAYLAPAIDMYNEANQLPVSKQKEYNALIAKSDAQFQLAKPYLLKAVELNPKSREALGNLKNFYRGTKDMANVTATQAKIDALGKQ